MQSYDVFMICPNFTIRSLLYFRRREANMRHLSVIQTQAIWETLYEVGLNATHSATKFQRCVPYWWNLSAERVADVQPLPLFASLPCRKTYCKPLIFFGLSRL